jgi:hypothetical protein
MLQVPTDGRSAIFQTQRPHEEALRSAGAYLMKIPFTEDEVMAARQADRQGNGLTEDIRTPHRFS